MHHILLVDDDLNFRRSLAIQLEFEGYQVMEMERAKQAISYLHAHQKDDFIPDIIITDVRMPEMDGREFVMQLGDDFPNIPVLVISAFDLPQDLTGCPFIRKPFKIQQMVDTINTVINS